MIEFIPVFLLEQTDRTLHKNIGIKFLKGEISKKCKIVSERFLNKKRNEILEENNNQKRG